MWALYALGTLVFLFVLNWCVQIIKKPSEAVGVIDSKFFKTPAETWKAYETLFKRYATPICTPHFLAALAQTETMGNPIARTYWVWRWNIIPWKIYAPASTATGMLQITDGTFDIARQYCVRDGKIIREGRWNDFNSCWFNGFYNRLFPSHAIEMTSAYLHVSASEITQESRLKRITLEQQQNLAATIHLCGFSRGRSFARQRFRWKAGDRCGGMDLSRYLGKVRLYKTRFKQISQTSRLAK